MPRSRSDIANAALRVFLQQVGKLYDTARGFEEYRSSKIQKQKVLAFFNGGCCYCGVALTVDTMCEDHLVPLNKDSLGLHAWGNVVPACASCNKKKHFGRWPSFLREVCRHNSELFELRCSRIAAFLHEYRYDVKLKIHDIASNLYQDVGAVAMTLVDLRFKQAEAVINEMLQS